MSRLFTNEDEKRDDLKGRSRRDVLAMIGSAGLAAATLRTESLWSQIPAQNPRRLDMHHHFASPRWIKRLTEAKRQGWETIIPYTPAQDIEGMDKGGVATAFLSVTEPGLWYGDEFEKERQEAISMARDMNEFGARMVSDYKGRFGLFAVLPLPDVEASLREIEYAFDTLKADGVGLLTSYGSLWLGDPKFHPVFDELNRRGAVVFSHPTDATCCHNLANANPATLEWFTDTTRSILSVIAAPPSRTGRPPVGGSSEGSLAARCPNIKFIWSHAGGTLIGAVSRVVGNVTAETLARPADPNSRLHHVRRFYYDTAGSANPIAMQGITKLVGISQIVFGSDYPWGTSLSIAQGLEACGLSYPELKAIDRENVVRFMPKYT